MLSLLTPVLNINCMSPWDIVKAFQLPRKPIETRKVVSSQSSQRRTFFFHQNLIVSLFLCVDVNVGLRGQAHGTCGILKQKHNTGAYFLSPRPQISKEESHSCMHRKAFISR